MMLIYILTIRIPSCFWRRCWHTDDPNSFSQTSFLQLQIKRPVPTMGLSELVVSRVSHFPLPTCKAFGPQVINDSHIYIHIHILCMLHRHYIYITYTYVLYCYICYIYIYRSPMISSEISPSGPEASKATRAWWSSQPPIARTSWIRRWCDRAASIDRFRQEIDLGQDDLLNLEIALLGGPSPSYFLGVEHSKTCPTRFFCMIWKRVNRNDVHGNWRITLGIVQGDERVTPKPKFRTLENLWDDLLVS